MNLSAHISSLNVKHSEYENEISYEMKRPMPDFVKLSGLKKRKLALKTEITRLLSGGVAASSA